MIDGCAHPLKDVNQFSCGLTWGCTEWKNTACNYFNPFTVIVNQFYLVLGALLHFAWGVSEAKCIVVTAVCLSVPWRIFLLLHGPGC